MAEDIKWKLKKPILQCLHDCTEPMSAEQISTILNVEIHKVSMCLLRLKRQGLIEAPESAKRTKDLVPRPGHRDRARQFYMINKTKGLKRLLWYIEQERLLREPYVFRDFWQLVEDESKVHALLKKVIEPIPECLAVEVSEKEKFRLILEGVLCGLSSQKFAVERYRETFTCLNCWYSVDSHITTSENGSKFCPMCGKKLANVIVKRSWEPCKLMIVPFPLDVDKEGVK